MMAPPDPVVEDDRDMEDDAMVTLRLVPTDPVERRGFEMRLAQRRAGGGERAAKEAARLSRSVM
jgi:hypothetical protein